MTDRGNERARLSSETTVRLARAGVRPPVRVRTCEVLVVDGPDRGRKVAFSGRSIRIGKGEDNDVVLTDTAVSRNHLVIEDRPEGVLLKDLGSTNGTIVNGLGTREAYLPSGATVVIGKTTFRFGLASTELAITPSASNAFGPLIGHSRAMRELFGYLERVAPTDLPVVLLGETGTGKEMVARAIHEASARRKEPLVVFDCATCEPGLVAASLFGHTAGAFTGAAKARKGAFVAAHRGTLFIDEVGELPLDLQPMLLRALELFEVQPLGSDEAVKVDVRLVSATHRDLESMVAAGKFRQDLFYRLSGLVLELPPLRERPEDVVALAQHFLASATPRRTLASSALQVLAAHAWPGNVRELRKVIDRTLALFPDPVLEASHLLLGSGRVTASPAPGAAAALDENQGRVRSLEEVEREAVRTALESCDWNKSEAARTLGITRQTLREKIARYGIVPRQDVVRRKDPER